MVIVLIAIGILLCAVQAIRVTRLLNSALWLAGTSALIALLIYLLGAPEIAVIELSVGAGLVTVLFVFAINIAGEETYSGPPAIPKILAFIVVLTSFGLLGWLALPGLFQMPTISMEPGFKEVLWEDRKLDVWLQIVLIFAGVLGILGLLTEGKANLNKENK